MKKLFSKTKITCVALCCIFALLLTSCGLSQENLHGEELLKLSDDELFETVYLQNLDIVYSFSDEDTALSRISLARRTVYILSIFDMEIQNGGLCQFFVNSSRALAPYIDECLKTVNAEEHRKLFSEFITENNIDLNNLDSFRIAYTEEYSAFEKQYAFDAFDDAYCELTALQDCIVDYIKFNIAEF